MVLPEYPSSSYRRYKEDTNIFTTWLSQAAIAVGYKPETAPGATQTKPPKGKAKQKAKAKARASRLPPPKTPNGTVKHKVSTQDLLKQVAAVGQVAAAKVRMPVQVRRVLERAITARLRCTEWFEAAHVESRRSNEGHMHFIGVLQNALDTLSWSSSSDGNALVPPAEDCDENMVRDLQNRFATLDVEDVDDEFALTSVDVSNKTQNGAEVYELEVNADWEDAFTVYCFFQDLHTIQDTIKRVWTKYKDGKLDLVSATVTINAGIQLVHRAEMDLLEANPQLNHWGPYSDIAMTAFYAETLRNGRDPQEHLRSPESLEVTDLEEFIYLPTARILDKMAALSRLMDHSSWPLPVPQLRFSYIARPELLELPKYQKLEEQDKVLTQLLHDAGLVHFTKSFPGAKITKIWPETNDEFTKSLEVMWTKGEVNMQNVFASRVMLDILDICGDRPKFHQNLLDMGNHAKRNFESTILPDDSMSTGDTRWLAKDESLLMDTYELLENHIPFHAIKEMKRMMLEFNEVDSRKGYSYEDAPPELKRAIRKNMLAKGRGDPELDGPSEEHKANARRLNLQPIRPAPELDIGFTHNPLLCGTLALQLSVSTEAAGLALSNHHLSIFATAHLYNALRQLSLITTSWPALDRIIGLHAGPIFANDVPKNPATMHARISFRLGTTGPTRNFNRHQKWKMQPAAASAVLCDYLTSRQPIEGVVMQIKDALQAHAPVESDQAHKQKSSKHLLRRRRLTPLQFVEALQSYMPTVLPDITVDYIALTKTCNELMRALRARLEDELGVVVPSLAYPGDSNDHGFLWMVLQILEETRREEQVWEKRREAGEERFEGGEQLRSAGETVEAFLNEHGGVRVLRGAGEA